MRNWLKISGWKVSPLNSILLKITESRTPVNPWSRVSEAWEWIVYVQWERLCEEMRPEVKLLSTQYMLYLEATISHYGSGLWWLRKCFQGWGVKREGDAIPGVHLIKKQGLQKALCMIQCRRTPASGTEMQTVSKADMVLGGGGGCLLSIQASAHLMSSTWVQVPNKYTSTLEAPDGENNWYIFLFLRTRNRMSWK